MDHNREIEDLIDLTDTSESSSSSHGGVFETHQPFVLELHDIRKDDPLLPVNATTPAAAAAKIKKHKKKKKDLPNKEKGSSSDSSDSLSEASSVTPSATEAKEEFYDAHESYHAMPESQTAVVAAARLQAHSETVQNPKASGVPAVPAVVVPTAGQQPTNTSTARKEPSTVTKPSVPPE